MDELDFPYNLPIWRDKFQLGSPDGKWAAKISRAGEVSMGNPTSGTLELSNGFKLDNCNPSFIWSDDSRYLVIPQYFHRFGLFRRQRLILIDVIDGSMVESKKTTCYFQPESFAKGQLIVTEEPFSDAVTLEWHIPDDLNQFEATKGMVWP